LLQTANGLSQFGESPSGLQSGSGPSWATVPGARLTASAAHPTATADDVGTRTALNFMADVALTGVRRLADEHQALDVTFLTHRSEAKFSR